MKRGAFLIRVPGLVLLSILFGGAPALATWSNNTAANNPICLAVGTQDSLQAIYDGAGGVVSVWQDARSGGADIYAMRLSSSGVRVAGWSINGTTICNATDQQLAPVLCSDDANGAIIAWQDRRGGNYDIYAQRVLANGTVAWAANGVVVCNAANDQTQPAIVRDGQGGAIITWEDRRSGAANSDIRALRLTSTGAVVAGWTANGVAISLATGDQLRPQICTDALNGALMAWQDRRSGTSYDVYATRILSTGIIAPGFVANGTPLCTAVQDQILVTIDSDSANGAIVGWQDHRPATDADVYAQRLDGTGATLWTVDGAPVCVQPNNQSSPIVIADGQGGGVFGWTDLRNSGATGSDIYSQLMNSAGAAIWALNGVAICAVPGNQVLSTMDQECQVPWGAFFGWEDGRGLDTDVYVGRILATGVVPGPWINGVPAGTSVRNQFRPDIVFDHRGGVIASFTDSRTGTKNLYAQRLTCSGIAGDPNPVIGGVNDVPNDQGGHLRIRWTASPIEMTAFRPSTGEWWYRAWRDVPSHAAATRLRGGATALAPGELIPREARPGLLYRTVDPETQATNYWELVASVPARGFDGYSLVVNTTGDSVGGSNPQTAFMIQFEDENGYVYNSEPVSGYSVDNLPPAQPGQFGGYYSGGAVHLGWNPNTEADLRGYHLHRGLVPGFVPGPANLVSVQADTGYADTSPGLYYYKLAAEDVHGNLGAFTLLAPGQVVGAPELPGETTAWLNRATPNPFRSSTAIEFGLPRGGHLSVNIFDVTGRRVRALLEGDATAGVHALAWDGRDDEAREMPGGLYFYRLESGGQTLVGRVMKLR